jgi:transposase-like protein
MWPDRTKYKSYDDQKLLRAYEEVVLKGISVRRAAADYGIPHTTLADRVSG